MHDHTLLYPFLARAFLRPPDEEMLELASNLLSSSGLSANAEEHTWLFEFNVYPYASVYLDPSGMLNAPWSDFVAGVYGALELELSLEAGLAAPDHLSAQLEALATLLERETSSDEMGAERARHAQKTLLAEHLLPWLPTFSLAVNRLNTGLYGKLTALTLELAINHLEALIGASELSPFSFPAAENGLEEEMKAREALSTFIVPARSGMFLSREDVMRLGRSLDLPVRFAERAFMLEQLALAAADAERLGAFFLEFGREAGRQLAALAMLQQNRMQLAPLWEAQCELIRVSAERLAQLQQDIS